MELLDITSIIEAVIMLVIALAGTYLTYLKNKSDNATQLDRWVSIAVSAAEQAYKVGMTDDRKQYALDVLSKQGLKLDWNAIDDMIEAAVNQLPSGTVSGNSQKGEALDVIAPKEVHK